MKKNTMQIVIIVLLIILIFMVFGFGVYYVASENVGKGSEVNNNTTGEVSDSNNINDDIITDNNSNNDESNHVSNLSIDSELVKKLWNLSSLNKEFVLGDDDNRIKQFYQNNIVLISDLPLEAKKDILVANLPEPTEKRKCYQNYGCDFTYYQSSVVKSTWNKIFGSHQEMILKNKVIGCFHFQEDGSLYESNNCGGSVGLVAVNTELKNATKSDNEIVLYQLTKFISYDETGDQATYYSNYEKTDLISNSMEVNPNYKLIFKKDSNESYYFYSIERIK